MIRKVNSVIGIFCVYLVLLNISVLHSLSVVSKLETIEEQIDVCENWEFQCKNGRCIAKSFVCDGLLDCSDNSDETYDLCRNLTCDKQYFQCHYGACIKKKYQCDGLKQCIDGSDELAEICDVETHTLTRNSRAADNSKSCNIPAPSAEKTANYLCADNTSLICNPTNGLVSDLTIAVIKCTSGYEKGTQDEEDENDEYICRNKKWRPKIDQCLKICDKLNFNNVNLRCSRNGVNIPCDENTVLLQGTTIRPSCKPTHKYSTDSPPAYLEITCKSDGKWDNTLFSCIPECGKTYKNPDLLVKGGTPEKFGDSPWHVAIYDRKKILICGGTIISPYLVISAAHCFHDEGKVAKTSNGSNYEVVVGKVTRDYNKIDSNVQKIHKIKKIRFSEKGYYGATNNFQADIAILVLEEKLNISLTVLPACLDWVALRDGIYPADDSPGKVVGWGINEYGNYSESLMTVELPFLSHERCLETVPENFKPFITFDKFCAGSEKGPGVLQGDSGGGLLFKKNNYYYLHGIVSVKEPTATGIAAFTDIAEHVGWISKVRNEIEEEFNKIAAQASTTTKATPHDANEKIPPSSSTNRPSETPASPKQPATTPPPIKKSVAIALENCKKYGQYRYTKKWQPPMANRAGYWHHPPDCLSVVPLIVGGVQTKPKEYPHMALIGYARDNNIRNVTWNCGGSLISEKYILSTAVCGEGYSRVKPRWVLLGDLDIKSTNDDARPAIYDIVRVHSHPNYNAKEHSNDISLFELNTTVAMSPYVRPACLYTSLSSLVNTRGSITGWGKTSFGGNASDHLSKATVTVLDDRQCSVLYSRLLQKELAFDWNSMICAGDLIDGKDSCQGDSGGPLQMPIKDQTCMWNIFGLTSFGYKCGDPEFPAVYTKVAYHLDWIQSIVWPS